MGKGEKIVKGFQDFGRLFKFLSKRAPKVVGEMEQEKGGEKKVIGHGETNNAAPTKESV